MSHKIRPFVLLTVAAFCSLPGTFLKNVAEENKATESPIETWRVVKRLLINPTTKSAEVLVASTCIASASETWFAQKEAAAMGQ